MNKINKFKERYKIDSSILEYKVHNIIESLQLYYTPNVKSDYKKSFSYEYGILKSHFPNIDFSYEGRIKNSNSLEEKVYRKIRQGRSGNVYDIFAKKIIVYSVNGCKDEELLIAACYEIAEFLKTYNQYLAPLSEKCKDYISSPKLNNYQAIHIIRQHVSSKNKIPSYCSETQIRTSQMEERQKFGSASHMLSYKPSETLKIELCPTFLEIGKSGKTYELSSKQSFSKYYSDYDALQKHFSQQTNKALTK